MDFLINVDQARDIAEKASKKKAVTANNTQTFAEKEELKKVSDSIFNASVLGELSCSCWIYYTSTYEALIKHGYFVFGGRIGDKLPESERKKWGTNDDAVLISWDQKS